MREGKKRKEKRKQTKAENEMREGKKRKKKTNKNEGVGKKTHYLADYGGEEPKQGRPLTELANEAVVICHSCK